MPSLLLCGGSLEVSDPETILREYVDPASDTAYPGYDRLVTNGTDQLVDADLLAPGLLQAPVDRSRFRVLSGMMPALQRVGSLPKVALQEADDDDVAAVAQLFDVLDSDLYRRGGVRGTIVAKVLHRKRPDLVPLYDSRIFAAYTVAAVERAGERERSWVSVMDELCRSMRSDLQEQAEAFEQLSAVARDAGAELTWLRILDIVVWRSAADWQ